MKYQLELLDQKLQQLNMIRPLHSALVKSITDNLLLDYNYNSNAIEGNTVSIYETKAILENGITIKGKTLKEHIEIINHNTAVNELVTMVQHQEAVSEELIKKLHTIIMSGTPHYLYKFVGNYRDDNIRVTGTSKQFTSHYALDFKMPELIKWYKDNQSVLHPVVLAAELHGKFVNIHPFFDGNGRTARLLMNLELMKNGYPITVIQFTDRYNYYSALDASSDDVGYDKFTQYIIENVDRTLDIYLEEINRSKKVTE